MVAQRCLTAAAVAIAASAGAPSGAADMVGVVPSDGIVMFVKGFSVRVGTTIRGVEFSNNDARTVFPEVLLVRGESALLSEGSVVARSVNVQETAETAGIVRVVWEPAISAAQDETYHAAVRIPAGPGKQGPGNGPAIGAENTRAAVGSFLWNDVEGAVLAIGIDLDIRLVTDAAKTGGAAPEESFSVPSKTFLAGAQPNPAIALTTIRFGLRGPGIMSLAVYDIAGRRVRLLESGFRTAGVYSVGWDGRDDGGENVAAGVYMVRLSAGSETITEKIVLAK